MYLTSDALTEGCFADIADKVFAERRQRGAVIREEAMASGQLHGLRPCGLKSALRARRCHCAEHVLRRKEGKGG